MSFARHPSLSGRVIFVTGGASGIGADIVRAFAEQDARVAFVDIQDEAAKALVEDLALSLYKPLFSIATFSASTRCGPPSGP